MNMILTFGTL